MILAVDIGGTRTRLAWFEPQRLRYPRHLRQYMTTEIRALPQLLHDYSKEVGLWPSAVAIGVAGPVVGGRSFTVNLPWAVDAQELRDCFRIPHVAVLNDLEAAAYGIALLEEHDCCSLQAGVPGARGNQAVLAAGTGLGEAGLYWDGSTHHPFATEGGHATFSPSNETEDALSVWLRAEFGHVSWERVLSGPGLVNIYRFLQRQNRLPSSGKPESPHDTAPSPEAIAAAAQKGDAACQAALQMFCRLYGAEAANLALKLMATGGVFIAGSIAVQNLDFFKRGEFISGFRNKGRMRPLLEAIPVRVVLVEELVLLGAARYASLVP